MNNRFEPTKRDLLPFHEVSHRLLVIERENSFAGVRFLTNEIYRKYADLFPEDMREEFLDAVARFVDWLERRPLIWG